MADSGDVKATITRIPGTNIVKYTKAWQAAVGGTKTNQTIPDINGMVLCVVTDPGATAPAANYDLVMNDSDGCDVMGGALANRSATLTEQAVPLYGALPWERPVMGTLTIVFSNLTNADCNGEYILYVREG